MMQRQTPTAAALLTVGLMTGSLLAGPAASGAPAPAASTTAAAGQRLDATLRGGADGDPNGTGHAVIRLYPGAGKVCARVTYAKIGTPNAAHIHRRSTGAIVVDLTGSVTDAPNCNRQVRKALVRRILEHPRRYYFNVHNNAYPAGAIQGVLHR
jgi:hypothetical protein